MQQGIQKLSFFLVILMLMFFAVIPLLGTIQSGFDSTDGYYQKVQAGTPSEVTE